MYRARALVALVLILLGSGLGLSQQVVKHGPQDLIIQSDDLLLKKAGVLPRESSPLGDEQMLKNAGLVTDSGSLLDFLRKRTLSAAGVESIRELVHQLGDPLYRVRTRASAELVARGAVAVPFLRQALTQNDLETRHRAEECLRLIESGDTNVGIPAAVVRLLAARKPAGASLVLLDYLPFAQNEAVREEVEEALAAVAVRDGKADAALVQALASKDVRRRGAAAAALCRAGQAAPARKLLQDDDPLVRFTVALELANSKVKEAVPVLIDLLDQLPPQPAWQAEDLLLRLAGDQAPAVDLGRDAAAHHKCREVWTLWWQQHSEQVNLSRLHEPPPLLGYTLLVLLDAGKVMELDAQDRPRFQFDGLQKPLDAQMLPGERVLIAEHDASRVTERNRKGEILWEKLLVGSDQVPEGPLVAQRLPNGNTFIATERRLLEVDRDGKEVFQYVRPPIEGMRQLPEGFMRAVKLPHGQIAFVTNVLRRFIRIDSSGKELQTMPVMVTTSGGRIDVLPNYHVLVPERQAGRVVEYAPDGQIVWQVSVIQPVAAVRLPNGHTLVTSFEVQRGAVELDADGKEVWQYSTSTRVTRAFRR
jgi:PQQ-like domain